MQLLLCPAGLWQELIIDFITNLLLSRHRGCVYNIILVIVNRYTKIVAYVLTTKKATISNIVELFFKNIIYRYSTLKGIITNYRLVFTSIF